MWGGTQPLQENQYHQAEYRSKLLPHTVPGMFFLYLQFTKHKQEILSLTDHVTNKADLQFAL
jgi:hypothetical protein